MEGSELNCVKSKIIKQFFVEVLYSLMWYIFSVKVNVSIFTVTHSFDRPYLKNISGPKWVQLGKF